MLGVAPHTCRRYRRVDSIVVRNAGMELRDCLVWDVFDTTNSVDAVARTVRLCLVP